MCDDFALQALFDGSPAVSRVASVRGLRAAIGAVHSGIMLVNSLLDGELNSCAEQNEGGAIMRTLRCRSH